MSTTTNGAKLPRSPASSLPGVKRFANAVWYRSKTKLKDMLEHAHGEPGSSPVSRQTHWVPPEIWGIILADFAYDAWTLKACAATCFAWYNIAAPYLHHTLKLRRWAREASRAHLSPLEPLHKLDLLDFVKRVEFEGIFRNPWLDPAIFDSESLRYFRTLKNLQDLTIADLDFSAFSMGVEEYFGHFSPKLRLLALNAPRGTRRQLLDFFALFPQLESVEISNYPTWAGEREAVGTLVTPAEGRLGGRLTLKNFGDEELLKDMIAAYGGMRFTSMELQDVQGLQLVLETCASTLETVYIQPGGALQDPFPRLCDLSRNTALQSLELPFSLISHSRKHTRTIKKLKQVLSTITSPAFSEIVVVFSERDVRWPPLGISQMLRDMYGIKKFRVAFCLQTLEKFIEQGLYQLTSYAKRAAELGAYKFLPCPPLVFARTETRYDRPPAGDE